MQYSSIYESNLQSISKSLDALDMVFVSFQDPTSQLWAKPKRLIAMERCAKDLLEDFICLRHIEFLATQTAYRGAGKLFLEAFC